MIENYVVIDLEMTGLNAKRDVILEVGAVRVNAGQITETFSALLNTGRPLTEKITELTGITNEMVAGGREPEEAMAEYFAFLGEDVLVGQNLIFDYRFLKQWAVNHKFAFERKAVDTLKLARKFLPKEQKKDLESLCQYFEIERENAHRALDDAKETALLFERMRHQFGTEHPQEFEPKPLQYRTKKQTPATARQKQYLRRYADAYGLELPDDFEYMSRSEMSRLTDRLILEHGKLPEQTTDSEVPSAAG